MSPARRWRAVAGLLLACAAAVVPCVHARDFTAASDAQVLEVLPPRIRSAAATPEAAALGARQWIELARRLADPRYLGRAQASLAPWWGREDAPAALATLQATVQQGRHEFDAARSTLEASLRREPAQPQAWLTLATLERVAGRYPAALAACREVGRTGAALYASACQLETVSLQGRFDQARAGLLALQERAGDAPTRAWLLSLLAESEERAGRDAEAARHYQASLALAPDGYTALAHADLLLRLQQPAEALRALEGQPASDAVLLRRARAYQLTGDARWKALSAEAAQRFADLDARGEPLAPHGRERALAALWFEQAPAEGWRAAQANIALQKEPLDWWLALSSAQRAGESAELNALRVQLASAGLRDARLARWQPPAAEGSTR